MDHIVQELGLPKTCLKCTNKNDRFVARVHKTWLKSLIKHSKLIEYTEPNTDHFHQIVLVRVYKKCDNKALPLPKIRKVDAPDSPLFAVQLMQYISQTNYKNLCKNAQKTYGSNEKPNKSKQIYLSTYNDVLKETLCRIHGCCVVNVCDANSNKSLSDEFESHANVLPAVCCVETLNTIFSIHLPHVEYTLRDCVNFSPAILEKCYTKPLFVVYQLLQAFRSMHDRSLVVGDITLDDILITDSLWIYILPKVTSNVHIQNVRNEHDIVAKRGMDCSKNGHEFSYQLKCVLCGIYTYDRVQRAGNETLERLCQLWIRGDISNFTYITALNNLSGRKFGDPNCHHVFPWVTDFASRCGKNWRDLKKSKFRLNKGDRQLDLTYESTSHHVSDVLSAITYYVYMARRTPKSVLCKHVRTVWVPGEYPNSIQRMQEWTPDECIPEFFTDPTVFRSIHDDLDDLEVPPWCSGPEDFVERHREALESQHVSERLHHWIDLTFGFKLSGNAAVKAKNVCLHLADEHTNLTTSGVVQLFTQPHPPKCSISEISTATVLANKTCASKTPRQRARDRSYSSIETGGRATTDSDDPLGDETNARSSLGFARFLSQSRSSLNEENDHKSSRSSSVGPKTLHATPRSKTPSMSRGDTIPLPKELKPELALDLLEKRHAFFAKTFHSGCGNTNSAAADEEETSNPLSDTQPVRNSFTNFMYSESADVFRNLYSYMSRQRAGGGTKKPPSDQSVLCNYSEIVSKCRVRELQVLGCLIIEIFLPKRMQVLSASKPNVTLSERLEACTTILGSSAALELPPFVRRVANLLLRPENVVVDQFGLPQPNAHLLLEPSLHYNAPFSKHFPALYRLLSIVKDLDNVSREIDLNYHFDCDGESCAQYENLERVKVSLVRNVAECKIKTCAKLADDMFDETNATVDVEIVDLLLPHVRELIEDPPTSVLAAWYLFDPLSKMLGPKKTSDALLAVVLKLYETEPNAPYHGRIAKLYHHSFLLRLMVRLGLKRFLDNFTAPIVEAVGGYRDNDDDDKFERELHTHRAAEERRAHLNSVEYDDAIDDLPLNHSTAEEALDATLTENLEEIDYVGNESPEERAATPVDDPEDSGAAFSTRNETKISFMSSDSVIWLSHRLGPVLTARYLSRNLLKMLTLCYVGKENLEPITNERSNDVVTITSTRVTGDRNAAKVLDCLGNIAGLYGEQFILVQYIPHMSELIALCKRKITPNLEGGLISCLALLKHVIPYLSDSSLMDQLQDNILKNVIHPTVRLLGSTKHNFPSGHVARGVLARKYLDAMYVLSIRIGADMSRTHIAVPALQRFFAIFDKVHNCPEAKTESSPPPRDSLVELNADGSTRHWSISATRPIQITQKDAESADDSLSPSTCDPNVALEELRAAFTPQLAHTAYMPFLSNLGSSALEISLKNHETIKELCKEYTPPREVPVAATAVKTPTSPYSGSIGSNVAVIGNRIEIQCESDDVIDPLNLVSNKIENNNRHLRGNWFAYWGHEVGRSDKDNMFNFKQIKLQTFNGHTHSVKCLHVLDNENSFMSGGRDKTVKLWSLRSQGDGTTVSNCQWTYAAHKKSVLAITFVESMRLVASCDSVIHIWDPFMGVNVGLLESPKYVPVNTIKSTPAPSSLIFAATTEGTLKVIDTRLCSYVYELKVNVNPPGLIRCLALAPSGQWVATGQSSGNVVVLDTRTGLIVSSWRAHEAEILQLVALDDNTLISSSLDQMIFVWNVSDGKLKFPMRGSTEPVHCLNVYNTELISGSTGNRIGVHTSVDVDASFSSTKLRSDAFKGLLTSMSILPLNRLLLLGADTGSISLLC